MREDKVYATCFSQRSEGHAVYKNESAEDIRPGACGYFDYDGSWVTVVQTIAVDRAEPATGLVRATKPVVRAKPRTGKDPGPAKAVEHPEDQTDNPDQTEAGGQTDAADQTGPDELTEDQPKIVDLKEVVNETEAMDLMGTLDVAKATELMEIVERTQSTVTHGSKNATPTTGTGFSPLKDVRLTVKKDQEAWGVVQAGSITLADYEAMAKIT
jgi:hypothetical protein